MKTSCARFLVILLGETSKHRAAQVRGYIPKAFPLACEPACKRAVNCKMPLFERIMFRRVAPAYIQADAHFISLMTPAGVRTVTYLQG